SAYCWLKSRPFSIPRPPRRLRARRDRCPTPLNGSRTASASAKPERQAMSAENRPNIVFILTDQQRFDTIRALGFDHMDTPNLDRLVQRGTSFTKMYVTSPSCAPSRASLFTGTYPHTNGVMRNGEPWPWSWVTLLNRA